MWGAIIGGVYPRIVVAFALVLTIWTTGRAESCDKAREALKLAVDHQNASRYAQALEIYAELLPLSGNCGERFDAELQSARGELYFELNTLDSIRSLFGGLARLDNPEHPQLFEFGIRARIRLAQYDLRLQNLDSAYQVLVRLDSERGKLPLNAQFAATHVLYYEARARALRELSQNDESRLYLDKAAQLINTFGVREVRVIFEVLFSLAKHDKGRKDYAQALQFIDQGKTIIARQAGKEHHMYASFLSLEGRVRFNQRQYEQALVLLDSSIVLLQKAMGQDHPSIAYRLNEKFSVLMTIGRHDEAIRDVREAVRILKLNYHSFNTNFLVTQSKLAILHEMSGRIDSARTYHENIRESFENAFTSYYPMLSEEGQMHFMSGWKRLMEKYLSFALRHKSEFPDLAENALRLHMKVRGMSEYLATQTRQLSGDLQEYSRRRRAIRREMYREMVRTARTDSSELHALQLQLATLEAGLSDEKKIPMEAALSIDPDSVRNALAPDQALVDIFQFRYYEPFVDTTDRYCAFVWVPDSVTWVTLPVANFDVLDTLDPCGEIAGNLLQRVVLSIVEPIIAGKKELFIAAGGALQNFPFACLHSTIRPDTRLATMYRMVSFNSYTALLNTSDTPMRPRAALFGNPVYASLSKPGESGSIVVAPLEGAAQELKALTRIFREIGWRPVVIEKEEASELRFKELPGERPFSILHIAAHGSYRSSSRRSSGDRSLFTVFDKTTNPMLHSGILLEGTDMEDGFLTAYELAGLNFRNVRLGVISACSSGQGAADQFEGAIGLQRAMRISGIPNLILTNWDVQDRATEEFMTSVYTRLCQGIPLRRAFSETQRQMSQTYSPEVWAAFTLWGGLEDLTVERKDNPGRLIAYAATALLCTLLFYRLRRRYV